jgi:flagellar hook-associated protein 1 FlgK
MVDSKGNEWKGEYKEIDDAAFNTALTDAQTAANATVSPAGDRIEFENENGTITVYTKITDPNDPTKVSYSKQDITKEQALDDNDLYGKVQSIRELLTESGEYASAGYIATVDESAATKRGIQYYRQALDSLANKVATEFNKLNSGYRQDTDGNYIDSSGNPIMDTATGTYYSVNGTYKYNAAGEKETVNTTENMTDAEKAFLEANGDKLGGVLFSNSGDSDDTTNIGAGNISIAKSWAEGAVQIVKSYTETVPGMGIPTTASDNIDHFIALMNKKISYAPSEVTAGAGDEVMFTGTFQEWLTNMSEVLGSDYKETNTLLNTYEGAATELDTNRDAVSSVDLNDEAMNLMQYQKSYSAACRLMTTIDEVLDKLINGTGKVGL